LLRITMGLPQYGPFVFASCKCCRAAVNCRERKATPISGSPGSNWARTAASRIRYALFTTLLFRGSRNNLRGSATFQASTRNRKSNSIFKRVKPSYVAGCGLQINIVFKLPTLAVHLQTLIPAALHSLARNILR
jgi:hypothetical protein